MSDKLSHLEKIKNKKPQISSGYNPLVSNCCTLFSTAGNLLNVSAGIPLLVVQANTIYQFAISLSVINLLK